MADEEFSGEVCPLFDPTAQFSVYVPESSPYSDPKAMQPVIDKLKEQGLRAAFTLAANGLPEKDGYGAYTLITQDCKAKTYAPQVLKQFGLTPFKD